MLGPYRDPVPVDADLLPEPLPDRCITAPQGCSHHPPPAVARPQSAPLLPPAFARALSASVTLLFLAMSASIAANTWMNASTFTRARSRPAPGSAPPAIAAYEQMAKRPHGPPHRPAQHPLPPLPAPLRGDAARDASLLARLGPATHHVETLWQRARDAGTFTLARATVVRGAVAPEDPMTWTREPGGLRVTNVDPPWPVSLLGLRRGDLVTSINGFTLGRPEDAAFARVALGGNAVVELVRDGRLVALRIDWAP